ncbi:DUF1254 domain-containing protein [Nocardia yamanashiensis]|uniref:DUF1254 domain-containing protein n=1 Tax=Nocardia yamanashiensis TaxID=209247 RepID=UPI001E346C72|nr:DUF1254 domain-containing protein [Nocardia yamanashiensis]UGT43318.1 DUF1254 domain-containing protein [Nocardia yamanashiensis]
MRSIRTRRTTIAAIRGLAGVVAVAALAAFAPTAAGDEPDADTPSHRESTVRAGYDYAFPLYFLSKLRWEALETTGGRTSTTLNHFAHSRSVAGPEDKWANAPLVDGLYSTAWIDLAQGPVYLDTPDTGSRYYVLTLIDFYSNTFSYTGTRTTGNRAQHQLLVGPNWNGQAPAGISVIRATTNDVYVNLRVQTSGPADQAAANAVQDGFTITPAPGATAGAAVARVQPGTGPENYLAVVNQMLTVNPPPAQDDSLIKQYRKAGICGEKCDFGKLPKPTRQTWEQVYPSLGQYMAQYAAATAQAKGWLDYSPPGSLLGTTEQRDYARRALSIGSGTGMLGLRREEANYWITFTDGIGRYMTGDKSYTLRLPQGGIPAQAFWSITLYEVSQAGQFLTPNPISRYAISGDTPGLATNPDGSVDLAIQSQEPQDATRNANWLPAPANGKAFILFARAYIPAASVIAGDFKMPQVTSAVS